MSPFVAFDMDDVLANIRTLVADVLGKATGRSIPWESWTTYDLGQVFGIPIDHCLQAFIEHTVLERAQPEPGAAEAVTRAIELGFTPAIISARAWHPNGQSLTRDWLDAHGLPIQEVHLVPLGVSKSSCLQGLGNIAAYVDDHLGHILDAQAAGIPGAVLMDRPWNRFALPNDRVYSLAEFALRLEAVGNPG